MTSKLSGLILLFALITASVQAQFPNDLKDNWAQMHKSKDLALQEFNEAKFEQNKDGLRVPIPQNFAPQGGYVMKVKLK